MAFDGTPIEGYAPAGHAAAIVGVLASWAGILSPLLTALATIFTIAWMAICVWESATCRSWRDGLRHWKNNAIMKHRARKLARLKARELKTQAAILAQEKLSQARVEARGVVATAAADAARVVAHEPVETAAKLVPPIGLTHPQE